MPRSRGEIKQQLGVEVSHPGKDHPSGGKQHTDPENQHKAGDVLDLAIERQHGSGGDDGRE